MGTTLDKPINQTSEQWNILNSLLLLEGEVSSGKQEQIPQTYLALDSISITVIFVVTVLLTLAVLAGFQCCLRRRLSQMRQNVPRRASLENIEESKKSADNELSQLPQDLRISNKDYNEAADGTEVDVVENLRTLTDDGLQCG